MRIAYSRSILVVAWLIIPLALTKCTISDRDAVGTRSEPSKFPVTFLLEPEKTCGESCMGLNDPVQISFNVYEDSVVGRIQFEYFPETLSFNSPSNLRVGGLGTPDYSFIFNIDIDKNDTADFQIVTGHITDSDTIRFHYGAKPFPFNAPNFYKMRNGGKEIVYTSGSYGIHGETMYLKLGSTDPLVTFSRLGNGFVSLDILIDNGIVYTQAHYDLKRH